MHQQAARNLKGEGSDPVSSFHNYYMPPPTAWEKWRIVIVIAYDVCTSKLCN